MKAFFQSRNLWLLLSGAGITALTLIFPQIGFLEWFSLIPVALAAYRVTDDQACTARRAYGWSFLTVYFFCFVLYHWVVLLYPLDFIGFSDAESLVVVIVSWIGLPLLQAIPGGLIFLLLRLMGKRGLFKRFPLLRPFALAALWTVFEWMTTLTFLGVPWGRLSLGQISMHPMVWSASVFGSYFVTFILVLFNALLAYLLWDRAKKTVCLILAASFFVANPAVGLLSRAFLPEEGETVRAAVVQGNIGSHDKWSSMSTKKIINAYSDLTRKAAAEGAELVIWPETTLPFVLNHSQNLQFTVTNLAVECRVTLIVGALYDDEDGNEYNALYQVDPDGTIHEEFYAKRHLVPFGEYVPFKPLFQVLIPPLAQLAEMDGGELTPGDGAALFDTPYGKIGSLICFDSIYEALTLDSVREGAEILLVSSNDSWFYDSAAVYQHKAQAQLRAIESGKWIIRSANTGISAFVTPDGDTLDEIAPLEKGYAVTEVPAVAGNTLYTRVGNLFVYLCLAFCACLVTWGLMFRKKEISY